MVMFRLPKCMQWPCTIISQPRPLHQIFQPISKKKELLFMYVIYVMHVGSISVLSVFTENINGLMGLQDENTSQIGSFYKGLLDILFFFSFSLFSLIWLGCHQNIYFMLQTAVSITPTSRDMALALSIASVLKKK